MDLVSLSPISQPLAPRHMGAWEEGNISVFFLKIVWICILSTSEPFKQVISFDYYINIMKQQTDVS